MIHEEYERLLGMLEKGTSSDGVPLEEILKEAVAFFERLRSEFPKAEKEEREEMVHMMTKLHAQLQEVAKKTAESAGMSEEELNAFSEDPSNFSPEQWRLVQETKRKLYDSARKFSSSMEKERQQKGTPEGEGAKPAPRTVKKRVRRPKKKGWMKS